MEALRRQALARPEGTWVALRRVSTFGVFGALPAVLLIWWLVLSMTWETGDWGFDFRQFWQGAHDVVHGESPYPSRSQLETADESITGAGIRDVFRFPYPAPAAVLLAPFGALPFDVAMVLWAVGSIAAIGVALRLLGVADWRVVGVVAGSAPVIGAVRLGTLTPLLLLLVAVAWRWRDRRWVPALALAVAVVLKLFLWPVVLWLVATRRYATAARTAALSVAVVVVGWAAIGFDGISLYPDLVRRLSEIVAERGFSLTALGVELGLADGVARALPVVAALALLVAVPWLGRRADGDRRALSLAVVGALVATPIVWLHYFTLLAVPLALARPRLSWAWGVLWLLWLTPAQESRESAFRIAVALAAVGLAALATTRPTVPAEAR